MRKVSQQFRLSIDNASKVTGSGSIQEAVARRKLYSEYRELTFGRPLSRHWSARTANSVSRGVRAVFAGAPVSDIVIECLIELLIEGEDSVICRTEI